MYVIILVDSPQEAQHITMSMRNLTGQSFKIQGVARGQAIRGLRHNAFRPTHIIDLMEDRSDEKFEKWFEGCVKPMLFPHVEYVRDVKQTTLWALREMKSQTGGNTNG
jgi:hypothetical protein